MGARWGASFLQPQNFFHTWCFLGRGLPACKHGLYFLSLDHGALNCIKMHFSWLAPNLPSNPDRTKRTSGRKQRLAFSLRSRCHQPPGPAALLLPGEQGLGLGWLHTPGTHSRHGPAPSSPRGGTRSQPPAPCVVGAGHTCCGVTDACSSPSQELK